MTNEQIVWHLERNLANMTERKKQKFGEFYPWRKHNGQGVEDSYELGFIQATAGALNMLGGFDPCVTLTSTPIQTCAQAVDVAVRSV